MTTKSISYRDGDTLLEGYLAYDETKAGRGRLPGVLIVHEWWGLTDYPKRRAEELAALGYVAFCLDMYGKGVVTTDAKRAGELAGPFYGQPTMASRARVGLDQLLGTDLVDPGKVAVIGYCFGGTTALELAFSGAPLQGVVTFHGGLHSVPAEAGSLTSAKFLICHGALDQMAEKDEVETFVKGMNDAKFDYQFILYSGAAHGFTNPKADEMAKINDLHGALAYNAAADRRSFAAMRSFFAEIFRS